MTVGAQVKQTLATIKGAQSTIRIYSKQSRDQEARVIFEQTVEEVRDVIADLEKRIQVLENEEPQYKGY